MTQFIALSDIGAAEKMRLLAYVSAEGDKVAHAPLSALVGAAFVRHQELEQATGFRQYADGSLIQWGQGQGIDPEVMFVRPFSQSCWHVSLTGGQEVDTNRMVIRSAINITLSSFVAQGRFVDFSGGGGHADTGFGWMAFGI